MELFQHLLHSDCIDMNVVFQSVLTLHIVLQFTENTAGVLSDVSSWPDEVVKQRSSSLVDE